MALTAWQPVGAQPPFEVSYFGLIPVSTASKTESFKLPKGKYIIIPMIWGRDNVGTYSIGTVSTSPSVSPISTETLATLTVTTKIIEVKKYVYNFTESTTVTIQFLCSGSSVSSTGGYSYLVIPYNNYVLAVGTSTGASATSKSVTQAVSSGKHIVFSLVGSLRQTYNCTNTITAPSGTKLSDITRMGGDALHQANAKEIILQTTGETLTLAGTTNDGLGCHLIYLIWKMS